MDDELKQMIQQNQETLLDLEKRVQKIQNKMMWNTIGSVLKIILIIAPLIWGAIYLSPILKEYTAAFGPLLDVFDVLLQLATSSTYQCCLAIGSIILKFINRQSKKL